MFRYTPANLQKLEELFREAQYVIRYEKGSFKPGYCILLDKKVIVINKFFDTESRINALLDILSQVKVEADMLGEKSKELLRVIEQLKATA